jgi:hypothetical protein
MQEISGSGPENVDDIFPRNVRLFPDCVSLQLSGLYYSQRCDNLNFPIRRFSNCNIHTYMERNVFKTSNECTKQEKADEIHIACVQKWIVHVFIILFENQEWEDIKMLDMGSDRLCGLVTTVPGYRSRDLGFDSRRCQIFWEVVDLERGPLSLVTITEELFEGKSSGPVPENQY